MIRLWCKWASWIWIIPIFRAISGYDLFPTYTSHFLPTINKIFTNFTTAFLGQRTLLQII